MKLTLQEITKIIDGKLNGGPDVIITGAGDIDSALPGQIIFIKNKEYLEKAQKSSASAVISPPEITGLNKPSVTVAHPYLAFTKILNIIYLENRTYFKGIHPAAIIGKNLQLGKNVSIGPYTVIGDNVRIGDDTIIASTVFIGDNTVIGKTGFVYPNVSIRENVVIGNNIIIHCGTVIGGDGCGFIPQEEQYIKVPQIGNVVIGDDVEIGSNVAIDRGTIKSTIIGSGTKIDNLVHIAHNVSIGENSMLLAHSTFAGSTKIGRHAIFSGQSGAIDNLKIGDNVIAASRAAILNDIPDNSVVWGIPAIPINEQKKIIVSLRKLPDLIREVKELKKKLDEFQK